MTGPGSARLAPSGCPGRCDPARAPRLNPGDRAGQRSGPRSFTSPGPTATQNTSRGLFHRDRLAVRPRGSWSKMPGFSDSLPGGRAYREAQALVPGPAGRAAPHDAKVPDPSGNLQGAEKAGRPAGPATPTPTRPQTRLHAWTRWPRTYAPAAGPPTSTPRPAGLRPCSCKTHTTTRNAATFSPHPTAPPVTGGTGSAGPSE